ncbi:MAG: FG-GAP repeat domain-containing protein [Planctomycetota bacterium]
MRRAGSAEDFRIALTCCGANNVALIDGNGKVLWELSGRHFESIDIGRVIPGQPGPQVVVDIDHQPYGKSPIWVLNERGEPLGQIVTDYSRHHCLLDWTGDGVDEILVAHKGGLYNDKGRRIGTFHTPGLENSADKPKYEKSMLIGDMTGDGIPDVVIATPYAAYIYKNKRGRKPAGPVPLGTEFNFTLY